MPVCAFDTRIQNGTVFRLHTKSLTSLSFPCSSNFRIRSWRFNARDFQVFHIHCNFIVDAAVLLLSARSLPLSSVLYMSRVYLSHAAAKASSSAGAALLVGQRCIASASPSITSPPAAVIVVAECVPCEDAGVVDEQLECLERVLPFGIEVVGVSGSASEVTALAAHLQQDKAKEWVAVVRADGPNKRGACHILGTPSRKVEVAEGEAAFVEVRFALHSCEQHLPLLLTPARGGPSVLLDGESTAALRDAAPSLESGAQFVQLGVSPTTLRVHVVLAPAFVSARGVYDILQRQMSSAVAAGTTRLVEVQSHNTHISYCCRMEPDAAAQDAELPAHALEEVFELIEDATGAAPKRSDVKGGTPSAALRGATAAVRVDKALPAASPHGASALERGAGGTSWVLLLGVAVLVLGAALVMMQ